MEVHRCDRYGCKHEFAGSYWDMKKSGWFVFDINGPSKEIHLEFCPECCDEEIFPAIHLTKDDKRWENEDREPTPCPRC